MKKAKRQTPSDLRREQLKRTSSAKESLRPCKSIERDNVSIEVSDDRQTIERCCSQSVFRSVTELSTKGEELSCFKDIDMNKALKGLANYEALSVHPGDLTGKTETASFISEFHIPEQKIPLDLSMKTYARLVSSSFIWLHRLIMSSTYIGMPHVNQDNSSSSSSSSSSSGSDVLSQVLNPMSLHSWVYPRFTVTSGPDRDDSLRKQQSSWEDAFRSLYYMLRKNQCKMFYVCTSQFVAMFMFNGKHSCNAYITQSTRRLRHTLKDHDISYSMPLCKTKIDQTTAEDLAEITEIENHNLGQIHRLSSFSSMDNTPESFLAFNGNDSVHGLYDLLLNYRSFLGYLVTSDVPLLYSPVPFQNAAISLPEIKCTEKMVEIKGEYIPPWIISNICAHVVANEQNFEASFVTEPTSISLNIGLPQEVDDTGKTNNSFSIHGAVICTQLRSGHLKSLKYCNKSYNVSLSPSLYV